MPVAAKLAVIYRGNPPRLFEEGSPEAPALSVEFMDEGRLQSSAVLAQPDYTAVFYQAGPEAGLVANRLAQVFPGAEIIGFETAPADASAAPLDSAGRQQVQLPLPYPIGACWLQGVVRLHESRSELLRLRTKGEKVQDLLDVFLELVDTSWSVEERMRGIARLMENALSTVRATSCLIYQKQMDGSLRRTFGAGETERIESFEGGANRAIVERVAAGGAPYRVHEFLFQKKPLSAGHSRSVGSVLCLPLVRDRETIGAIEFLDKLDGAGFTEEDQEIVGCMMRPLAVALRNLGNSEVSDRLAIIDDLTQLYNYRYLMQFLDSEVKRCLRYGKVLSLLFIDIDGFKRINDNFGHQIGSRVLSEIGRVFKESVRGNDVVGRYGGDEFVIVLPEASLESAAGIAERLRAEVESRRFVAQDLGICLTVSLGVASFPDHAISAEGLLQKADAAMYNAKQVSKNTIKVAV